MGGLARRTTAAHPFLKTPFEEYSAVFSPDGQWLAYNSNESGPLQVYATHFPDGGAKTQISTDGGSEPVWSANGRELFYRNLDRMMSVAVTTRPAFTAGRPQLLFTAKTVHAVSRYNANYAVTPDGHFIMIQHADAEPIREINVVLNWFEELKRRVPLW